MPHKPLPYYPISQFYKQRFGSRVQKIPVSVVDTCPNRMGLKGMQTCSFCDVWGSAAYPETREQSLREQIEENRLKLGPKNRAEQYLVYFQAYTNTFTKLQTLRSNFETALSFPQVRGVVVGTRPDCLSKGVLDLWTEFHKRAFVSVELGVQSLFDDQLIFLRRGHTAQDSIVAIERIRREAEVDLGIHLMFGLPGETDEHVVETAKRVSSLPVDNVKLHNLHVLKNTPLEHQFAQGEFTPIDLPAYAHRVSLFLQHLNPQIAVHRLAALSSRWEELVAPDWTRHRMRTHQAILDKINSYGAYQGQLFEGPTRPWEPHLACSTGS